MPTSDHVAGEGAPADTVVRSPTPLVTALQALYRAYQKTSIYPEGHPAIPDALTAALQGLDDTLAGTDALTVGIGRDRLTVDEQPLEETTGAVSALASLLHDLGISRLEFRCGIDAEELKGLALLMGRARQEGIHGPAVVEAWTPEALPHVRLHPVDYGAVQFEEGPRTEDAPGESELLEGLATALTSKGGEGLPTPVNRETGLQDGNDLEVLRRKIDGVQEKISKLSADQREAYRKRMSKFVSALSRRLRWDLLRVSPDMPEESLERLSDLAEVMPAADLLEALQHIDAEGSRVPGQMLTLINKLVRLSHPRPGPASGSRDTPTRGGEEGTFERDPGELREALLEVFQRRGRHSFNPQPYQDLLDDLSRSQLEGAGTKSLGLYRDPSDVGGNRLHKAEIAMRLLGAAGGDGDRAALFGHAATVIDDLIDAARFDELHDAALTARAYSLLESETDGVQRAAKAYLECFLKEKRIAHLLTVLGQGQTVPDAAVTLLGLGGVGALNQVFDVLASDPPSEIAGTLRRFAVERNVEDLARVVKWRVERGWSALYPVFPVLREMEAIDAAPLLESFLDHEEFKVRREALLVLQEHDDRSGGLERHLRRCLADPHRDFVGVVLSCLAKLQNARSADLLGGYLEGRYSQAVHPHLVSRAARLLAAKGEAGLERLCRAQDVLARSLRPRRVRAARTVHAVLGEHRSVESVARCLARWRRSRVGLLSWFLPRQPGSGDGADR